jgi:hypothetical protein
MVSSTFVFVTTVRSIAHLPNSTRLLCMTTAAQLQKPIMKNWATSYGDSITDLKPHFECCLKNAIQRCPRIYSGVVGCLRIFVPHNPYRVPPHYKRNVYEPSHRCTYRFSCLQFSLLDWSQHYKLWYTTEEIEKITSTCFINQCCYSTNTHVQ